jgi:hypothetical protein
MAIDHARTKKRAIQTSPNSGSDDSVTRGALMVPDSHSSLLGMAPTQGSNDCQALRNLSPRRSAASSVVRPQQLTTHVILSLFRMPA